MGINRKKEQVRDGYLCDLPDKIQSNIMSINKLINETMRNLVDNDPNYHDIQSSQWAMSCIDQFCITPTMNGEVGSVRVYKSGKQFKCVIQVTGTFINHQYGWIEELLNEIINNVYDTVKPKIRKKYDYTITNEGGRGEAYEAFNIYLPNKVAQEIWDLFDGRTTRSITESILVDTEISGDLIKYYGFYSESMSYDDYFYEKQHSKLKHDYRIGFNLNNGKLVAIQFDLDPSKVTAAGDIHFYQQNHDALLGKDPYTQQKKATEKLRKVIAKEGHIDHRTEGLMVSAIFDRSHKSYKEVDILPLFSDKRMDMLDYIYDNYPDQSKLDSIYDEEEANKIIEEWMPKWVKASGFKGEHYRVGEIGGNDKYKTTSIFWTQDQFTNFRLAPVLRGVTKKKNYNSDSDRHASLYNGLNKPNNSHKAPTNIEIINNRRDNLKRLEQELELWKSKEKRRRESLKSLEKGSPEYEKKEKLLKKAEEGVKETELDIERYKKKFPDLFKESTDNTPSYNVDMSEQQAKRTLRTLSQGIINDIANKKDYKVTQYTANIYANIITKNLLPIWAKGFRKFSITLDSYQSFFTFEFKPPKMTQDFVARFVDGRESINGLLHREPEIKVKMSPRIFHTMKNPDDAFNFFKSAIQYYDSKLEKASESLMVEIKKLGYGMKHLISNTKMSGLVTCPMSLLFVFDDVHMDNKDTFKISKDDISTINKFVRNISSRYAAPEKEKSKIIEDVKEVVKTLRESCGMDDNIKQISYLPEAVQTFYDGGYDELLDKYKEDFIQEQTDIDWIRNPKDPKVKYYQEKFGVKKLKKIPTDTVAYISIETESIKDANDKMMISSYCLGKIEIVEWYIELLETGSKKYVVPHTKPYLESLRTQLLACFKKIMDTPIPKAGTRPIIDIEYPKGYEG